MALELSTQPMMPLDFSSGSNRDNSGSPEVNVSDSAHSPPGSSAFTVVTPKGREGKWTKVFNEDLLL